MSVSTCVLCLHLRTCGGVPVYVHDCEWTCVRVWEVSVCVLCVCLHTCVWVCVRLALPRSSAHTESELRFHRKHSLRQGLRACGLFGNMVP